MFSNTYLKINTKKSEDRFIQTDNHCTYFIISDFNNPDDGLWSSGFHIFDSIIPEEPQNVIESKIFFPTGTQVTFAKKYILNYLLFKNDNGFLIEINNKNIIYKTSKEYKINFNINSKFEIIEKNIKNIILEYPKAKKEERGLKKMLCAISVRAEYDIKNIEKNENGITFITQPIEKGIKEPDFYVLYNSDYNELKKQLEINIERLEILKKEHFKDSISSLRYLDFQTELLEPYFFHHYKINNEDVSLVQNVLSAGKTLRNNLFQALLVSRIWVLYQVNRDSVEDLPSDPLPDLKWNGISAADLEREINQKEPSRVLEDYNVVVYSPNGAKINYPVNGFPQAYLMQYEGGYAPLLFISIEK